MLPPVETSIKTPWWTRHRTAARATATFSKDADGKVVVNFVLPVHRTEKGGRRLPAPGPAVRTWVCAAERTDNSSAPDGPIVLLLDEGLQPDQLGRTQRHHGGELRHHPRVPGGYRASRNVYRNIARSDAGVNAREVANLCSLVAPPDPQAQRRCAWRRRAGSRRAGAVCGSTRRLYRRVKCGSPVLPDMRFEDDVVPFASSTEAVTHVRMMCRSLRVSLAPPKHKKTRKRPCPACVSSLASMTCACGSLKTAVVDARGQRASREERRRAAASVVSTRILAPYLLSVTSIANADLRRLESHHDSGISRRPPRHGDIPPPCPLLDLSPKLAMLSLRLTVARPTADGPPPW